MQIKLEDILEVEDGRRVSPENFLVVKESDENMDRIGELWCKY